MRALPRKSFLTLALVAAACALPSAGCGGETLVLAPVQRPDPSKLDADPVSILPAGILVFAYIDAAAMFRSSLGPDVTQMVQALLPLGAESNFVPSRDVTKIFAGAYAMQGADFCAIVQGNFDADAIRRAVDARTVSLGGVPMAKNRYADSDIFTAGNIGFTVLTAHTVLSGNETGIRRTLDRIRYGKLTRAVPEWMTNLGRTPGAAFSIAGDLSEQSPAGAAVQSLPVIAGANTVRIVGNFQAPAMNIAASLTFNDEPSADASVSTLQTIGSLGPFASLLSAVGLGITIPPIQSARIGKDVGFTVAVDEALSRTLLRKGGDMMRSAVRAGQR
jgi:hypothetical protein